MKKDKLWNWIVFLLGLTLFTLGAGVTVWGIYIENGKMQLSINDIFLSSYGNLGAGLIEAAITILIIDTLYRKRESEAFRTQLLRQIRSTDNFTATQALEELDANGWLKEHSLVGVNLSHANLEGCKVLAGLNLSKVRLVNSNLRMTNLQKTDLRNAILTQADLSDADLVSTKLNNANLIKANLIRAVLQGADLRGAILIDANLSDSIVDGVEMDSDTILPDGSKWHPGIELRKFTR